MSSLFYIVSPLLQISANMAMHQISTALKSPVQKELLETRGIWRPLMDPLMLYPLAGAPFINAIILHQVARALNITNKGDFYSGCSLAFILWCAGPLHGMFINYTSLKTSVQVTIHFTLTTLVVALINGACYGYFSK